MNIISFMSANYVARPVNYNMTGGWGQGDQATNDYFRPVDTFAERFGAMLRDIRAMGFAALDLWTAQLNPLWATDYHIEAAREQLQQHDLRVISLAGWFGSNAEEFEANCKLAVALGTDLLGGTTSFVTKDRSGAVALLGKHNLRLGIENHPEKTPEELLAKIGDGGEGRIGAAVDTGWFGTQGFDAVEAMSQLRDYLFHVHLKDVLAAGAHQTCRYDQGVVPVEQCALLLREIGYTGAISIEHEPELFDPTEDCVAGYGMVRRWLEIPEEQRA